MENRVSHIVGEMASVESSVFRVLQPLHGFGVWWLPRSVPIGDGARVVKFNRSPNIAVRLRAGFEILTVPNESPQVYVRLVDLLCIARRCVFMIVADTC